MLHNIANDVNKNITKTANFCSSLDANSNSHASTVISKTFSEATEDISINNIFSFETNFLGNNEEYVAENSLNNNFDSNTASLLSTNNLQQQNSNLLLDNLAQSQLSMQEFQSTYLNQLDLTSTSINSANLDSALRCLADNKFNANIEDAAFSISDDLPLSLIGVSNLNSDASSDHDQQMINCIIKDLYDSRLEAKAMQEEMLRLRKEVDHLMNLNQGLLIHLNASTKEAFKTGFMT